MGDRILGLHETLFKRPWKIAVLLAALASAASASEELGLQEPVVLRERTEDGSVRRNGKEDPRPASRPNASNGAAKDKAPATARSDAKTSESEGEEESDTDHIRAGDTVKIMVYGQPDLTVEAIVPKSGTLIIPKVGPTKVINLTPVSLSKIISRNLRESGLLGRPDVTILITKFAQKRVFVYGAVQTPQAIVIPRYERLKLTQAIAMVGGFKESADQSSVKVIRQRIGEPPKLLKIDVERITKQGFITEDLKLLDGDTIIVKPDTKFYIIGYVNRPGAYTISRDVDRTVLTAIGLAGGFAPRAGSNRVRLYRRGKGDVSRMELINVKEILDKGLLERDKAIEPGSLIYVPPARM